ncbi:MAG: hypothetical protein KAY21_07685 [Limnohabitans sp.]|nr:hypothetical protein [Limnohabitans sp.]
MTQDRWRDGSGADMKAMKKVLPDIENSWRALADPEQAVPMKAHMYLG